ncbi:hypothetical protein [Hominisplanchenecus sp.]|uniref:hypothetical protein n=1 Tax=Hominisplanchenecus sp. TaxID=3038130 RepID=UPI0039916ACE
MEIGKQNNGKKNKKKRETDESIEFITVEEINRNARREPGFLFDEKIENIEKS